MSKYTKKLVELVERRASDANSCTEAQSFISQGADIKVPTKNGSMIHSVTAEEARHREPQPWKADNCHRLCALLRNRASDLLANSVLSSPNGGDLKEMYELVKLEASCYQSQNFGPLGLLAELLKQSRSSVRLDIVQFLVEHDPHTKYGLSLVDNQQQTCLSLAKANSQCSKEVIAYIQHQFDIILNQIPFQTLAVDINQVTEWVRRGANPEAIVDDQRNTVLSNAVIAKNLPLVRVLVAAGCNTSHVNASGLTPLEIAQQAIPIEPALVNVLSVQSINRELEQLIERKQGVQLTKDDVHILIDKGANINIPINALNESFLQLLIKREGTPDMISAFVNDFNADIDSMTIKGQRPIETIILLEENPPLNVLLTYLKLPKIASSIDTFFNRMLNKTLIQFSIEQSRPQAAQIIQNELNLRLWNCISRATNDDNQCIQEVKPQLDLLISYGAQIDHHHPTVDKNDEYHQWTVLHLACKHASRPFIKYLVEHFKAKYVLPTGNGDLPIAIAAKHGHLAIVQFLRSLQDSPLDEPNIEKQTALHLATKNHHLLVVRDLVRWGADHQARTLSEQTPLEIARTNVAQTKEEEKKDKELVSFLQKLICPPVIDGKQQRPRSARLNRDLDTCELVTRVPVDPIQMTDVLDEDVISNEGGFLNPSPNDQLHDGAKQGNVALVKEAIGRGADVRHRKKRNLTALDMTQRTHAEYIKKLHSTTNLTERQNYQCMITGCQTIENDIRVNARVKLIESIKLSHAGRVMAYHLAGGLLTSDLVGMTCATSDNIQIVDYLINYGPECFAATFIQSSMPDGSFTHLPYRTAMKKKHAKVAAYLKYRLSVEFTKAVKDNQIDYAKLLVRAGASVDTENSNNLQEALKHQNTELIQLLCDNGVNMPAGWVASPTIILPSSISKDMPSDISLYINQCLINRKLRLCAASGDLRGVVQCQRMGADIDSKNWQGSTALLCTVQYINSFPIVHALISCGASMLHANEDEAPLITIANRHKYDQIAQYLTQELNVQFLATLLDNDKPSAQSLSEMGANFNYQDEQKRTPLHYAVQYHGYDLVTWLCECGSTPTMADINGDYPIHEATEKGDYAVVKLFLEKYPTTKSQTNKSGATPLQIAEKLKYHRLVRLIKTGRSSPEPQDGKAKVATKKQTPEALHQALRNGQVKVMQEFCQQEYENIDEKRQLCYQLIEAAKHQKQAQILDILKPYYDDNLKPVVHGGRAVAGAVSLTKEYQEILFGFLTGLSNIIAGSPVALDPADPNTYMKLFSSLKSNLTQRSQEVQKVDSVKGAKELSARDLAAVNRKLGDIGQEMAKLKESKQELLRRMKVASLEIEQLKSAIEKKEAMKEEESQTRQLTSLECSLLLYQREMEATIARCNALEYFKQDENVNLYLFYQTIENRLQALFTSILAAQGGYLTRATTTGFGTGATVVANAPTSFIPFSDLILGAIKSALSGILSKLDEREQNKEFHNIATLGSIEELQRIASDTAGILTLYYKEQIESVDLTSKIKGSNVFNHSIRWLKDVFVDVRPEKADEMAIVIIAEYVVAWMIDTLKESSLKDGHVDVKDTKIDRKKPLPQQLWLCVAKKNPVDDGGRLAAATDVLGTSAGKQMIPLKMKAPSLKDSNGKEAISVPRLVQLRYLIGCVSVVSNDGKVYQYTPPTEPKTSDSDFADLSLFGYVYVAPFSSDEKTLESILIGRKLTLAARDDQGDILTRFDDIARLAQAYTKRAIIVNEDNDHIETAKQVAKVLREQKSFVDPKDVRAELEKARKHIEADISVYREDIEKKSKLYQTSIDAAHEQIKKDMLTAQQTIKQDNEKQYSEKSRKLMEQKEEDKAQLLSQITTRMNEIEAEMLEKTARIQSLVEQAKAESSQAVGQSKQALVASEQSAESAEKSKDFAQQLVATAEQRRLEMQTTIGKCQVEIKRTIDEQAHLCKQSITEVRTKALQDTERTKIAAETSASNALAAAASAGQTAQSAKETLKAVQEQLEQQKKAHKEQLEVLTKSSKEELNAQKKAASNELDALKEAAKNELDAQKKAAKEKFELQKRETEKVIAEAKESRLTSERAIREANDKMEAMRKEMEKMLKKQ